MKRNKHLSTKKNYLGIGIAAVILIVIVVLIFSGNDSTPSDDVVLEQDQDTSQPVLEDAPVIVQPTLDAIKEESLAVPKSKIGEKGLCEDYFFEQGDELKILDHSIIVERIGSQSLRVQVDGQHYVINEDSSSYLGDGIRLAIAKDKILYFGADDTSNAVMIRVGCNYDVNPNEKYVEDRGIKICKEIYVNCQNSFGIDLE